MRNCLLSYDPGDKLKAVIAADQTHADMGLPAKYLETCRFWFDDLTDSERMLAESARNALIAGSPELAAQLAMKLPAAPQPPENQSS